jgi:hypothetical protein
VGSGCCCLPAALCLAAVRGVGQVC